MTADLREFIERVRVGDVDVDLCPSRLIPSTGDRGDLVYCWFCTGEACVRHGHDPCDCDVVDRHHDD